MVREFLAGAALLGRGLTLILRRPRLFWLGALPPVITSLVFLGVLVALFVGLDPLVGWLTWFADDWAPSAALTARVVIGFALLAGALLLMVVTFAAVTLTLGSPLYDKISEFVDAELPEAPVPPEEPAAVGVARSVRQSLAVVGVSVLGAAPLFLAGLIPVVGQLVVPVVSVTFGAWMLGIELLGSPFERRGLRRIRERRAAMRARRARVLGLMVPTFLLLAVPLAAIAVFPVATAAATLLARDLVGSAAATRQR